MDENEMIRKLERNYGFYYINSGTDNREQKIAIAQSLQAKGMVKICQPQDSLTVTVILK